MERNKTGLKASRLSTGQQWRPAYFPPLPAPVVPVPHYTADLLSTSPILWRHSCLPFECESFQAQRDNNRSVCREDYLTGQTGSVKAFLPEERRPARAVYQASRAVMMPNQPPS